MKVDSGLCQPAGTPIPGQLPGRLGVTFVDVETDILRSIHVGVERRITLFTGVQTAFNALTVVFSTAHATHLARVALRPFYDFNTLDVRLVRENRGEAVESPPVQVEVAVLPPVFRLAVLILADTSEFPDVNTANALFATPFNNVFR